ncbi:MAG: hypothetical protein H6669_05460 [Ardenticatenaceae bacterium]|nr:hypothetical protein [Ardenticatenaceae bacterium]
MFVDERFWSGWPSLSFLVNENRVNLFQAESGLPPTAPPFTIYAWPYGPLDFVPALLPANALITVERGSLARGDLEPEPYPLYVRYAVQPPLRPAPPAANFDNQYFLQQASAIPSQKNELVVELIWQMNKTTTPLPKVFIHVTDIKGLIGQDDSPIGGEIWPAAWWQSGQQVREIHHIPLTGAYNPTRHQIIIGLYDAQTGVRLPLLSAAGDVTGDSWELNIDE